MRKRFLSLFLILTLLCPQIVIFAEDSNSALPENDFTIIEEGIPYQLDTSEEELPEYEPIIHTEELTGLPDDFLEGDYEDWPSFGESEISTYADITETNNYYVSWSKVFGDAYGSSFFSPTLQRKDGARIEGNTNRLIIEETDLHLPGKNGLDVVIKRRHDNQHFDDIYNLYRDTDSGIYIHAFYSFDFLDTDSGNIHRIVFPTVDDFYCYMSNGIDISEYPSKKQEGTCSGSDVSFYPATQIYNKRCEPSDTSIHLEPISTDYSIVKVRVLSRYSLDYRTSLNDIDMVGNGWSLLFPQARIYGYNYIKNERSNTTTVYQYDYISSFQDIYGGIHTFSGYDTFTRVTIGETATYQYTSSFYPEDNNYLTMERFFGMQTVPGTELEYNFAVYDNSGLTYYLITPTFSTTAKPSRTQKLYPVAVSDSYGNLIQYILDSSSKVTKIIDTYGKEINISSSGISYYDETKQAEQTIQYQTETLPAETLSNNSPIKGKEIIRLTVINPAGEETIYDSRQTELLISCDFVSASSGSLNDFLYPTGHPVYQHSSYNIERIIHPSGAESHYQYKRIYPKGDSSSVRHGVYAVEDAYTLSGNQRIAHQSYTLTNTSENITITGTNQGTGAITIQKYNADGLCTSQVTSPTGTTTQTPYSNIRTTYDSKFNPTSIIYSDSGLSKTTTASYQSLYPATISSTNDGKQFVKYTYHTRDDRLTGIPRVTTYQSGKNGEYSIETTLNDKLSVEYARVIQNNMLKAQTKYEYDNSGRVIKELQWIGDTNNDGVLDENDETTCLLHSYADENGTHTVTNTVTGLKDADGNTLPDVSATYIYDMHGNPIEQIDPNGNHSTISYDAVHRPLEITLPNGAKRTYSYDLPNLTTTATDEAGKQIKIQYDAVGNILGKYQKNNENWDTLEAYTYDAALRPLSVKIYQDSNLFLSEQYSYDVLDRLIQKQVLDEADSLQYTENYTYTLSSTNGTRKKVTTAQDGTVTAIATDTFNAYDEILSQAFSSGTVTHTTSATYDYASRPLTQTDPLGNITTYTYDYAGNVLTVTDELSNVQAFSYDMTGRKKSQTDAKGNTTTYTYDALDRLIQTDFPFADGITTKQKSYYDAASNLILAKNQNNAVNDAESYTSVAYSYDNMNRLTAVSGDTTPVSYTYDLAGRMLTHTTGTGSKRSVNRYTYDVNGFVTSTTDPLGNTETYTYDYAGNVKTKQDANGNRTQNTYGIFGLKQSDIFETDTEIPTISYQYTYNSLGWNTQKDLYENGVKVQGQTNIFDAFGRITQESLTNGTQKVYTYDKNSNRTGFTLSKDGTVEMQTAYTYDDLNRLATVTNGTHTSQYTYDAASKLTQEVTDGFTTVYAYNPLGLNTNVTTTFGENTIQNHSYTYALSGNVLQKQSTIGTQTNSYAYEYDNIGRLVSEQFGTDTKAYTYDAFGNRATMTVSGAENYTTAYAYDLNNQLKTETRQIGDVSEIWSYQYDNNGNQVSKLKSIIAPQSDEESISLSESGSDYMLYEYDGLNRLKKYADNDTVATYTYDDQNLRQTKTVNGVTTSHIWDGANMVMETAGTDTKKYYRTATGIGYADINGTIQYFHKDGHGDVTALTDSTGTITKTYTYDAFGTELNIDPTDSNPFRYCGEYFDQETGQIYLRNRYYNSSIGRFITEDPIRDGVNWYVYCINNPLNFFDFFGLEESRDKIVLTSEDYRKIQILTAVYNDAIANNDIYTADHAHAYATRIRQQEKYNNIEGYGSVYIDALPNDGNLYFSNLRGGVDNYDYSVEINPFALRIKKPLGYLKAELYSGRLVADVSNSQALSVAIGTPWEPFTDGFSKTIDITSLFYDEDLMYSLSEGDVRVDIYLEDGKMLYYYFHENSETFYYKKGA